jgi:hypothetical protein
VEVLTWRGLVTFYVLFFIEVGTRRVSLGGITRQPDSCWMEQVARNSPENITQVEILDGIPELISQRCRTPDL